MDIILQNYQHLAAMAFLLCLSGTFSGSETSLFSLRPADLNRLRRKIGPISRAILTLHGDLKGFLMTVLLCNLVVNILFFALSATMATRIAAQHGSGASLGFGLLGLMLVIALGEVTPKSLATVAAPAFCRIIALPMLGLHRAMWWVRGVLVGVVGFIERVAGIHEQSRTAIKSEELELLVQLSRDEGVISSAEHELIDSVLELPEVRMREIMTPRVDMVTTYTDTDAGELVGLARRKKYSKIPVRIRETDEVVGWVDARDVFVEGQSGPVGRLMRNPVFVSELDRADQVLNKMREQKTRLAIVVDERGATVGMVTLWDVLSEIFGEIGDEDAAPEEPIRQVGENTFRLAANVSVREWRDLFGVADELPCTATIGGLVTALLGRAAREGDLVRLGNLQMRVMRVHKRRIAEIELRLRLADADDTSPATGEDREGV